MSAAELDAVRLSLSVALRSVLFGLPLAVLVAWLLARRRVAGRIVLDAFVHLPLVLPPVVVGYLLLLLLGTRGPIGAWLHDTFGIQLIFTATGAAIATAVMTFPLMVRAIRISLEGVDAGLEDAARTLGAGAWIDPPFYCDYGTQITLGDGVFVNMNCVFLDPAAITIGAGAQLGPGVQLLTATHPTDAAAARWSWAPV